MPQRDAVTKAVLKNGPRRPIAKKKSTSSIESIHGLNAKPFRVRCSDDYYYSLLIDDQLYRNYVWIRSSNADHLLAHYNDWESVQRQLKLMSNFHSRQRFRSLFTWNWLFIAVILKYLYLITRAFKSAFIR